MFKYADIVKAAAVPTNSSRLTPDEKAWENKRRRSGDTTVLSPGQIKTRYAEAQAAKTKPAPAPAPKPAAPPPATATKPPAQPAASAAKSAPAPAQNTAAPAAQPSVFDTMSSDERMQYAKDYDNMNLWQRKQQLEAVKSANPDYAKGNEAYYNDLEKTLADVKDPGLSAERQKQLNAYHTWSVANQPFKNLPDITPGAAADQTSVMKTNPDGSAESTTRQGPEYEHAKTMFERRKASTQRQWDQAMAMYDQAVADGDAAGAARYRGQLARLNANFHKPRYGFDSASFGGAGLFTVPKAQAVKTPQATAAGPAAAQPTQPAAKANPAARGTLAQNHAASSPTDWWNSGTQDAYHGGGWSASVPTFSDYAPWLHGQPFPTRPVGDGVSTRPAGERIPLHGSAPDLSAPQDAAKPDQPQQQVADTAGSPSSRTDGLPWYVPSALGLYWNTLF